MCIRDRGKRCPVCNMYCVPIEEKSEVRSPKSEVNHVETFSEKLGEYYCPMFCEGDKTYPENVGCPVCGMDLVKITGNDDESEDDTYKNLQKKFWISVAFTLPVFILSMGGMFFEFPFSSRISGILQLVFTLPVVFFTGWFLFKSCLLYTSRCV